MSDNQTKESKVTPTEVWVLRNPSGKLVPPIDDDGTDVFMAWPSREQAEAGLKHQIQLVGDFDRDTTPVVERLF